MIKQQFIFILLLIFGVTPMATALPSGKPFQELITAIEHNLELIEANQVSIETLESTSSQLQAAVDTLNLNLSGLETRVSANETELTDAMTQIDNLDGGIGILTSELDALEARHDSDLTDIRLQIAQLRSQIIQMNTDLLNLSAALTSQLATLQGQVDTNTIEINGLTIEILATNAKAMNTMLIINSLDGRIGDLEIRATAHEAALADLTDRVAALEVVVCGPAGTSCVSNCGNGTLDAGEEFDPAPGPFASAPVQADSCRWDFSNVSQFYCNGTCSISGGSGCDQTEADRFCKIKTDNPQSVATSFGLATALPEPGFGCHYSDNYGTQIDMSSRGVTEVIRYQDTSLHANHGGGTVIVNPTCTNP